MNSVLPEKKIVLVNGYLIRQTLDTDFGLLHERGERFSQFSPKFYIPSGEIWLDHLFAAETDFLLDAKRFLENYNGPYQAARRALKEKMISGGAPGAGQKVSLADLTEREDRVGELTIRTVGGDKVRQFFDPEFIFGGHDLVYPDYIPTGEIWLDSLMDEKDRAPILFHEQTERALMAAGKTYDVAHEFATAAEREHRRLAGGFYPGDAVYPWAGLSNEEIIKTHYVVARS